MYELPLYTFLDYKNALNVSKKKYIPRKFEPKAYYKIFDWEHYVPADESDSKEIKESRKKKNHKILIDH